MEAIARAWDNDDKQRGGTKRRPLYSGSDSPLVRSASPTPTPPPPRAETLARAAAVQKAAERRRNARVRFAVEYRRETHAKRRLTEKEEEEAEDVPVDNDDIAELTPPLCEMQVFRPGDTQSRTVVYEVGSSERDITDEDGDLYAHPRANPSYAGVRFD